MRHHAIADNDVFVEPWARASLGEREHELLSGFIEKRAGIHIPPSKRALLEARLRRRLRALEISTFEEYCKRVLAYELGTGEVVAMMDAVTTNKTDFFREPFHFKFLTERALPELTKAGAGWRRDLRAWSAACSTGEEPYTIAMVLSEFGAEQAGFRFHVLATDICTSVLTEARRAVYRTARIAPVPPALRGKYLMSSRNRATDLVRVSPGLRQTVSFRELNLLDAQYGVAEPMDIIFCRNVLIYFQRNVQMQVCDQLAQNLRAGGYLVLGQSETLEGTRLPMRPVAPTIYRKA